MRYAINEQILFDLAVEQAKRAVKSHSKPQKRPKPTHSKPFKRKHMRHTRYGRARTPYNAS